MQFVRGVVSDVLDSWTRPLSKSQVSLADSLLTSPELFPDAELCLQRSAVQLHRKMPDLQRKFDLTLVLAFLCGDTNVAVDNTELDSYVFERDDDGIGRGLLDTTAGANDLCSDLATE